MDCEGSYVSNDQNPYSPTNLHKQLEGETPQDWKNDSIDYNSLNNSIDNANITSGQKPNNQQTPISTFTINELEKAEQSDRSSHSSENKNQTINIYGQSMRLSTVSSVKSQGYTAVLKNFLLVNQNTYQKHIQCLERIISKVKCFNGRSLQNLQMYVSFFKAKYIQQGQYFERQGPQTNISENEMHDSVYINAKMALNQLSEHRKNEHKKGIKYLGVIKETKNYLDLFYKKMKRNREDEEQKIENHLIGLNKLISEIQTIILSRIHRHNQQDRYIQLRCLSEQEKDFIQRLYALNRLTLKFIHSSLAQQQVKISKTLKEYLTLYCQSYQECYGKLTNTEQTLSNLLSEDTQQNLLNEMADMMLSVIPNPQNTMIKSQNKNRFSQVIDSLRKQLQSNILLPCLEICEELVVFQSKANWNDGQSKTMMDIVVTSDRYIHLEKGRQFITMKLSDLKINRKGKEIIMKSKANKMISYFMGESQLGRLQFRQTRDIQDFTIIVQSLERKQ